MHSIHVGSEIRIPTSVPERALVRIMERLSLPNPAFSGAIARARMMNQKRVQTAGIPQHLTYYRLEGEWLHVPRGAVLEVRQALGDIPFRFVDERVSRPHTYRFAGQLRDYQKEAVDILQRQVQGIGQIPCGGGKTWLGAGFIARTGQRAVAIVPGNDLRDQWCETIYQAFGFVPETIGGDTPVCVDTYQRIATGKVDRSKCAQFGTIVLDEVHHVPAASFFTLGQLFPARWRLGLSATPERDDGLTRAVHFICGPTHYAVEYPRLFRDGHLIAPTICPVQTGTVVDSRSHAVALKKITNDDARNHLIRRIALKNACAGRTTMILSARKSHLRVLARMITPTIDCEVLDGKVARGGRRRILGRVRSGRLKVLLATMTIAKEGLDVPPLEVMLRATFDRAAGSAVQCAGRLTRLHEGKQAPILYDLVDGGRMPENHWKDRRRAYQNAYGTWYRERREG